ncbi:hypothetical protein GCM10027168_48900 [Streptomyces capparidis]
MTAVAAPATPATNRLRETEDMEHSFWSRGGRGGVVHGARPVRTGRRGGGSADQLVVQVGVGAALLPL